MLRLYFVSALVAAIPRHGMHSPWLWNANKL